MISSCVPTTASSVVSYFYFTVFEKEGAVTMELNRWFVYTVKLASKNVLRWFHSIDIIKEIGVRMNSRVVHR